MSRWAAILCAVLTAAPALANPQSAIAAALEDVRRLPPEIACRTRYLYADRPELPRMVKWWANGLSREAEFGSPRDAGNGVLAVILDEYRWDDRVWDAQFKTEPYFYYFLRDYRGGKWYLTPEGKELVTRTGTCIPLVRADWWFFYSSRQVDLNGKEQGFGYYDWLGIKDQNAFEALRFTDRKVAIKIGDELRAVLETGRSRVTVEGVDRQIEWYSTYGDGEQGLWITLDADDTSRGNTAPGNLQEGQFKEKAREAFVGLPNHLWGVGAFNAKGVRQATVPPEIAADNSPHHRGNDRRIHPFSCFHCHVNGGLQPVDDWARQSLRTPNQLDVFKIRDLLRLKRQYFRDLDGQLTKGRRRYAEALKECVNLTSEQAAAAHAATYYRYLQLRRSTELATLLGVTEACLLTELRRFFDPRNVKGAEDKRRLASFTSLIAREPRGVPVTHVEQFFGDLVCIVRGHR